MKIKSCLQAVPQSTCVSTALLLLRVVAGLAFVFHGWGKMQQPMSWMGPESPVPGFFQFLGAFSEFGGGIAWIVGFLMPLASAGIGFTMIVAASLHIFVLKDPFVSTGGGAYELALVYLAIAILFMAVGPGKFSADAKVFGQRLN